MDTVPVPRPSAREEMRGGAPPRAVSGAPASPPAHRGFSAAVALVQSAEAGNLTEVLDIIDAGVSPNARDTAGMTPLMMAVIHDHGPVAELLLTRGADVNAADVSGVTALMLAANNGRAVLLQRLLARGANVNAQTRTGWTALIYAAWKGHPSIVRRLIEFGADPALLDQTGRTALQYATWRAADPANQSAGDNPAPPAVAHRRYVEVIDVLSKASRPR